jgi:hypothetical protein
MRSINRVAIVIRPKQAFFEWAKTLEGEQLENPEVWVSVYLIETTEDEKPLRTLQRQFKAISKNSWQAGTASKPIGHPHARMDCLKPGSTPKWRTWSSISPTG